MCIKVSKVKYQKPEKVIISQARLIFICGTLFLVDEEEQIEKTQHINLKVCFCQYLISRNLL